MRAAGKDVAAQTVRLNGAEGFEGDAGTLVVSVFAQDAHASMGEADPVLNALRPPSRAPPATCLLLF